MSAHKLELDIPIPEEELVRLLISRYDANNLSQYGIHPNNCVIRRVEIGEGQRCVFKVCAVVNQDVESEIEERLRTKEVASPALAPVPQATEPPCSKVDGPGCPGSKPIRITRREKNSNETRGGDVSVGATHSEELTRCQPNT